MQLLYCGVCATLEELPDKDPSAPIDRLLEALVFRHTERDPMAHGSASLVMSPFERFDAKEQEWNCPDLEKRKSNREDLLRQINQKAKEKGFDRWVYDSMDTYREDALRCYRSHHRPTQGCIDYRDPSKIIGHPTQVGQKTAKEMYKLSERRDPALCDFCPVNSWVEMERRHRQGLYKV
jgi:hypothetical protein